jgi:hypothetical protein
MTAAGRLGTGENTFSIAELGELREHPIPEYPEYEQVRQEARRRSRGFVDPHNPAPGHRALLRRGTDWATGVLGFPVTPHTRLSVLEDAMLAVADLRGITPPVPARIRQWHLHSTAYHAAQAAQASQAGRRRQERSDAARAACRVPVTVRPNLNARRNVENHFVPDVDARSGGGRLHQAGRPLCETPQRHRPRSLGDPVDAPVTCQSCLNFAPLVRAA